LITSVWINFYVKIRATTFNGIDKYYPGHDSEQHLGFSRRSDTLDNANADGTFKSRKVLNENELYCILKSSRGELQICNKNREEGEGFLKKSIWPWTTQGQTDVIRTVDLFKLYNFCVKHFSQKFFAFEIFDCCRTFDTFCMYL